ncbi:MAG: type II secretion system F family protein [Nanoarchaeota archaeon]|nr:type II secretion system F family protein [Nanoarchaeota archaeon]
MVTKKASKKKTSPQKKASPKRPLATSQKKEVFSARKADEPKQETKKAEPKKKTYSASNTIQSKFDKKKEFKKRRMSKIFIEFLEKAGIQTTPKDILKKILFVDLGILGAITFITIISGIILGSKTNVIILLLVQTWTILFLALYLLSLLMVFFYLDIRITNRTRQIEDVLPDFLQLASANISAGMTIDRALWFAVRPRFGVLAKEIEEIAKSTIAGEDLSESLIAFTKKYDSKILKESVNLIVAGIRSGGEIGELLNKISENILDTKLMKKEVSASVTTYVIFIGVASILAAPGLFALSSQLLVVIQNIAGSLASSSGSSAGGSLSISFGTDSISLKDFKIFSIVLLTITSYFAAQIISVIRKGDGRDGLKNFPIFTIISLTGFFFLSYVLGLLLGGLF